MSQRLLISLQGNINKKKDSFFDCIYTENGTLEVLLKDWLSAGHGDFYFGPWRITIRDYEIWDQFCEDFRKIKNYCPKLSSFDDVWTIYDEKKDCQIHLSQEEKVKYDGIIGALVEHLRQET